MIDANQVKEPLESSDSIISTLAQHPELVPTIDIWLKLICGTIVLVTFYGLISWGIKRIFSGTDSSDKKLYDGKLFLEVTSLKRTSSRVLGLCGNMDNSISKLNGAIDTLIKVIKKD